MKARRRWSLRWPGSLAGGRGGRSQAGSGGGARPCSRSRCVVQRCPTARGYVPRGPKPPFTPGYELVGVVEELGPGRSRLREGDRVAALTVWGADAERVCVPEVNAVPGDLDPAEVASLVLTYMTAYQLLHRMARVKSG